MRFLHLADLHLDTPFAGRTEGLRDRLRHAGREALTAAVSVALEAEVDAVLIAGDLLDGEHLSWATERHLLAELARLGEAGVPVIYATGNHDPGVRGGTVLRIPWPDNVRLIASPEPVRVEVERDGRPVGVVTGAGHDGPRVGRDLSRGFPSPEGPLPQIGLLHTQVGGAAGEGDHHRYAPSERARLARSGHHYWALGHIHLRQELEEAPGIHYPGNLIGRSPRETGAKGGLLVDLADPGLPRVEFVELAPVRWERLPVGGLERVERIDALVRRSQEAWREARAGDPGRSGTEWLVRVELTGPSPLHRTLAAGENREELSEELAARLDLLDVEIRTGGLRPPVQVEPHVERQDVLGEALRLARSLAEADDPAAELELGPEELAGFDPSLHGPPAEYVRSLLEGAQESIADALLEGDA